MTDNASEKPVYVALVTRSGSENNTNPSWVNIGAAWLGRKGNKNLTLRLDVLPAPDRPVVLVPYDDYRHADNAEDKA